jgi:hypothetical protein
MRFDPLPGPIPVRRRCYLPRYLCNRILTQASLIGRPVGDLVLLARDVVAAILV